MPNKDDTDRLNDLISEIDDLRTDFDLTEDLDNAESVETLADFQVSMKSAAATARKFAAECDRLAKAAGNQRSGNPTTHRIKSDLLR